MTHNNQKECKGYDKCLATCSQVLAEHRLMWHWSAKPTRQKQDQISFTHDISMKFQRQFRIIRLINYENYHIPVLQQAK